MDRRNLARCVLIAALSGATGGLLIGASGAQGQGAAAPNSGSPAPASANPGGANPGSGKPGAAEADPATPDAQKSSAQKTDVPSVKTSSPQGQGGTSAVVMDLSALESVIGKSVKSAAGEDLGRIVDLLVTTSGQVRAAVIDFGGILGVGSRKVAVDWKALDFSNFTKDGTVKLGLTRNQVRVSPEYKSGEPVVILQEGKPDDGKPDQIKSEPGSPGNGGDGKGGATTASPKHDGAR